MSAFDHGAGAMLRKLIFGTRAERRDPAFTGSDPAGVEAAPDALPKGVSGGEDFAFTDSET